MSSINILFQSFSAGGPCEQLWHGQGCPLFYVVHTADVKSSVVPQTTLAVKGEMKMMIQHFLCRPQCPPPYKVSVFCQLPEDVPVDPEGS